jgi:tryptophanyl-tRNA synthetase
MGAGAIGERKRIVTGIRPTGPLHLGHYAGASKKRRGGITNEHS